MRKSLPIMIAAMSAGLALAGSASAALNLVSNGGFELSNNGIGQLGFNTTATNWFVASPDASYAFLFNNTAATTGSNGQAGAVILYGPTNGGVANPNAEGLSQDGGNFIGADPAFHNSNGSINQTIGAPLVSGQLYAVSFDWAADQQFGFSGPTTEGWSVTLGGGASQSTVTVSDPNHAFSGWFQTTLYVTAGNSNNVLSFLATGGPSSSQPPFALLDGVSMVAVPEPTTWALMIMGFGGVGAMVRGRRRQLATAA